MDAGKLVLSPTRTYAPVVKKLLDALRPQIHGMVHCSGGAQTKILHFVGQALPWVFLHIIGGCVTFVFSISFAVTMQTVYSHGVFDKHINQKQYPDFVGMGLSTGKSYFQAICDTTQTDLEPQGDGNEN